MSFSFSGRALAALVLGGLFLGSCGGSGTSTSTPSSTLGTDSAATKVGGMADTTGAGGPMSAPAGGTGGTTMNGGGTGSSGTSNTGSTMGGTTGSAGSPTSGSTGGASGTTNGTGAN